MSVTKHTSNVYYKVVGDKTVGLTKTRPNWARKVRELILFNVLCTLYCGRGCLSLESEGKEMRGCVSLESGIFVADNGQRDTRGVLRGPRGPKNKKCVGCLGRISLRRVYTCLLTVWRFVRPFRGLP